MWYVYDPRHWIHIRYCDFDPTYMIQQRNGFMLWDGELREVRDIHYTKTGNQVELY